VPRIQDELKYRLRLELMRDTAVSHIVRNNPPGLALPVRRWEVPCPSATVSAAPGRTGIAQPSDRALRRDAINCEMTIQDWASRMTSSIPTMIGSRTVGRSRPGLHRILKRNSGSVTS